MLRPTFWYRIKVYWKKKCTQNCNIAGIFNFLFVDIYFFWSFKYEVMIQKMDCVDLTFFLLKLLIKKMVYR